VELAEVPALLILAGLAAYVVLGGADFGAGFWHMLLRGEDRAHTYRAMGPVWEANHVWLIFVLVIAWTAYPEAFGSIASTLAVPLFIAAVGIILRGTAYALRGHASGPREQRIFGAVFGVSSVLTPFALGTAVGAIAAGSVPVGNAAGAQFDSWTGPTSLLVGALAVTTSIHLAAVWLAADAARQERSELVRRFCRRAHVTGVVAGALALGGLIVLREDARRIFDGLTEGAGLAAVLVSGAAGAATLGLVARRRLEAARYVVAIAVAAIVAGWALAQQPELLPGLTVEEAAAPRSTLVALVVSAGVGALILVPSLALLFGLLLGGRFDARPEELGSLERAGQASPEPRPAARSGALRGVAPLTAVCAVAGTVLTVATEGGIGRVIGVVFLLTAVGAGAALVLPQVALDADPERAEDRP
jgi:cytochrome d ubiquinol oxidase subunit II